MLPGKQIFQAFSRIIKSLVEQVGNGAEISRLILLRKSRRRFERVLALPEYRSEQLPRLLVITFDQIELGDAQTNVRANFLVGIVELLEIFN